MPILVFLLHRVPVLVVAKHLFAELTPEVFLGFDAIPKPWLSGGLQILQGESPSLNAVLTLNAAETFFTILQPDK